MSRDRRLDKGTRSKIKLTSKRKKEKKGKKIKKKQEKRIDPTS